MNIGYRVFVVEGNEVTRLSQKALDAFLSLKQPGLPQYSGRAIVVAIVIYQIHNRVPQRVIRTDSTRFKVKADGSLDEDRLNDEIVNVLQFSRQSSVSALPSPKLSAIAKAKMYATIFPNAK